jgi:hypothetical protein
MTNLDPILQNAREAKLRYLDHDFEIVKTGDFVRCAVSGVAIRLDQLKYWSIAKQVPFRSAREAFDDFLKS